MERTDLQKIYEKFVKEHVIAIEPKTGTYLFARPGYIIKPIQRKFTLLDKFLTQKSNTRGNEGCKEDSRKDSKEGLLRLLRSLCERMLEYCNMLCEQHNRLNLLPRQKQQSQQKQQKQQEGSAYQKIGAPKMLWAALRECSCQFMGPSVQQDMLQLIIRAFHNFPRLSRKCLVGYIVHMMTPDYPSITNTKVCHAIQILYRASCFNIVKQTGSILELRPELAEYDLLRRRHDSQIIKIGVEAGIRMVPEKWSELLYGDSERKNEMQSHIDRLLTATRNIRGLAEEVFDKIYLYELDQLSPAFISVQKDFEWFASIAETFQFENQLDDEEEAENNDWKLLSVCLEKVLRVSLAYNDFTARIQTLIQGCPPKQHLWSQNRHF